MSLSPTPPDGPPDELAAATPIAPARPGGVKAFLPNELDPTVFDEGFLRQLERLGVLMKQPVRGGLKGGRRSVKRGQSVEFADYRDYALGDDLRQLDWNVYARLEKLFVKLFIEEEDVTITFLIDASPSMAFGRPQKLLFAKRAAAALGYIGLASEDRVVVATLGGRTARRQGGLRGSGRVLRLLANLSAIQPAAGPTDLLAAARHAGAMLSGRGVVVLLSDLLDPGSDRVMRELAATGSDLIVLHLLSPDELDPPHRGRPAARRQRDGRGRGRDRGPRDARRLPGAPRGVADGTWPTSRPGAAPRTCRCPRTSPWATSCSPSCGAGAWSGR